MANKKKNSKIIPYGKQSISRQDISSILNVFKGDWLTQGPQVELFEKEFSSYCGSKYAVAVSNGTAALHLACLAAGLQSGDQGITTPNTFLASANAICYSGAKVIFADIELETGNIDPIEIKSKITKRTRVLIPVHYAGKSVNQKAIFKIAKEYKLTVIEDACHALGGEYFGAKIGSCKYSDMTTFSFHPVKNMTTGEGGMITTNSKALYQKLLQLRCHGMVRNQKITKNHGPWYYEMQSLGFNYRLTDLQAALGRSQLKQLDKFISKRFKLALRYEKALSLHEQYIILPKVKFENEMHGLHLYPIRLKTNNAESLRRKLYDFLKKQGIITQVHYIPVTNQPFYKQQIKSSNTFKNANRFYRSQLSLPIFPTLTNKEQDFVIECISTWITNHSSEFK